MPQDAALDPKLGDLDSELEFVEVNPSGLVDEGWGYFVSMSRDFSIKPRIEHHGCLVHILSRDGLIEDAYEFIKNMHIKPNAVIWNFACVLLDDAKWLRIEMKVQGIKKDPGCSFIELDGVIHEFLADLQISRGHD
ncbi:pentatricopeptide repeat-containing protein At5g66520 [Primulina huaijiensis]|uniref:pentatricopeptide repeat-containing protein At5g66520 n=1 Tax=Primulina huaijiensis TaxID=1492673 RepID=UPI003CC6FA79